MADQWAIFRRAERDTEEVDQWSAFRKPEQAEATPTPTPSPARKKRDKLKTALEVITTPIDGDTFRDDAGSRLRLWGADAPELGQPGYPRAGNPVDLGTISRDAAASMLGEGGRAGDVVSRSYGRAVAPVTVDGVDLGQSLIRSGNALAAPDFLADAPDRRFDYMQAERLARQNGLGQHDYLTVDPAQFRKDKSFKPQTETVAQFFDTPTPWAGLRPEAEQRLFALFNDRSVSPADVVAYARANGGVINPADVVDARARADKTGQQINVAYTKPPQILTDGGGGAVGTAARQFSSGILSGGLDEAGAVIDMFGLTDGRESVWNSDRRLADIWFNNQQQNSSILGYDEFVRPNLSTGAELTGAFLQPFPGGKFTSFRKLAGWGGAYAGAEGFLGTDGGLAERSIAGLKQVPIGVAAGGFGGKALEAMLPYAQKLGAAARERLRPAPRMDDIAGGIENVAPVADEWSMFRSAEPLDGDEVRSPTSMPMDAEPMDSLSVGPRARDYIDLEPGVRPQPIGQPLSPAQVQAMSANIEPRDVLPTPSNQVEDMAEAASIERGRIVPARPVDERTELGRQSVTNWQGQPVPKVGPVDMVGYLRTQGGLVDQGGELSAMGLSNSLAARRGIDHVGQEARFGPMVNNETGLTLDEAADRAWREGYFPDHAERPTTSEFLDALRDTYEGTNRRFLPDDMPQLERYDAARTDRLDLERRIAEEGPIYTDRSQPLDEPSPLPPVEAYEEWGGTAPDFAGNINLSKLESPQDITRALRQVNSHVGFDAATRGRVAQAETERLASELGMTPDALLARRKGQAFNAEEALAARQILAKSSTELVNAARRVQRLEVPGDELMADFRQKLVRHAAIQEQVAGMTSEAGRALAQFKMLADSRSVKGDVLAALVKRGGGGDDLKDAADTLLEAVETSPGKFNADVRNLLKPTWRQKVGEFYINSLLSGPQTHVVNMVSNTLTTMAQIPEFAVASAIGGVRRAVSRQPIDRVTAGELGARSFGLLQGAKEGALLFARALRTGEASDFASKVEGDQYKAIPGLAGEIIRVPTRFLTAEDELFKGIARRMELNAQAVRIASRENLTGDAKAARIAELVADPTDQMIDRALDYGRYLTFQTPLSDGGPLTRFAGDLSRRGNESLILKTLLPFIRTPTNLLRFAAERSPAAPILTRWRKDFVAGGARRDVAVARAMVGTGVGLAIYEAAANGLVTGSPPSDPAKARLMYADGWQPYSIKLGDQWYSYKRLDPFATTLGVAADLATLPEGMTEKQREDKTTLFIASIIGNLASKTWLSGVSNVVSAVSEPDRYADNMVQRLVSSFLVPGVAGQAARTMDPTQREVETVGEAIRNRTPGLSDSLLPRRDVWGRPIVSEGGLGPDFLSPIWTKKQLNDPVNSELLKLDYAPGYPSKKIGGRELSSQEYDKLQELAGGLAHDRLSGVVTSPQWKGLDPEAREKLAKKIVEKSRDDAKAQLFGGGDGGGSSGAVDPWSLFRKADDAPARKDEWSGFKRPPERDVVGELRRAIPGLGMTSGYRTPEYQADMRRRGYSPAQNSAHLDGSSIDLTPPPGKSMRWLMDEVAAFDPNASLLLEGDHLHATFPGWYGAPVLGGAKAAGLRNPNARRR